jgi:hypothetical protein
MSSNSPSPTTTSMNIADTPAARVQIGREIPNDLQSLASAAPGRLQSEPSSDSINSGMSVGSQLPTITTTPVDRKTIVGSTPGDHRIPAKDGVTDALLQASGSGKGPRGQMAGQRNSKFYNENGSAFTPTTNADDSNAGS